MHESTVTLYVAQFVEPTSQSCSRSPSLQDRRMDTWGSSSSIRTASHHHFTPLPLFHQLHLTGHDISIPTSMKVPLMRRIMLSSSWHWLDAKRANSGGALGKFIAGEQRQSIWSMPCSPLRGTPFVVSAMLLAIQVLWLLSFNLSDRVFLLSESQAVCCRGSLLVPGWAMIQWLAVVKRKRRTSRSFQAWQVLPQQKKSRPACDILTFCHTKRVLWRKRSTVFFNPHCLYSEREPQQSMQQKTQSILLCHIAKACGRQLFKTDKANAPSRAMWSCRPEGKCGRQIKWIKIQRQNYQNWPVQTNNPSHILLRSKDRNR